MVTASEDTSVQGEEEKEAAFASSARGLSPEKGEGGKDVIGTGFGSLDWSAFNTDLHCTVPDIKHGKYVDVQNQHGDKMLDLRAYMIPRPHTCFENDTI
jgi:hypothetical protein